MSALIKELLPVVDMNSTDAILASLKKIFQENGVVRLVIDSRHDNIEYWRVVTDSEAAEKAISFHDALRQVSMEEYTAVDKTPFEQVFEIFEMITDAGCTPSHIVSGATAVDLRKWIPISHKAKTMLGIPILFEGGLAEDVLVFCGSRAIEATAADVEYAVKVTIL